MRDEISNWLAEERTRARAKLLAQGTLPAHVDQLLSLAEDMHEAQADCAARLVGEAPAVVVH